MIEADYYYAIRISNEGRPRFLARRNASAPDLFWFHEDAVVHRKKCATGKTKADIVKVFVRWSKNSKSYNTPGDMFRSAEELKRRISKGTKTTAREICRP